VGSWNETCALSYLPIDAGDEIVCLLVVTRSQDRDRCGPVDRFIPRTIPLYGTYDDYGRIKLADTSEEKAISQMVLKQFSVDVIEDKLKAHLEHTEEGCNWQKVAKEDFLEDNGWDLLEECFHKSSVYVTSNPSDPSEGHTLDCDQIFILRDIWDSVINPDNSKDDPNLESQKAVHSFLDMRKLPGLGYEDLDFMYDRLFRYYPTTENSIGYFVKEAIKIRDFEGDITEENVSLISEMVDRFLQISSMHRVLHTLRRQLVPPSGKGSQVTEWLDHLTFSRAVMTHAAQKELEEAMYEDEEWDDDSRKLALAAIMRGIPHD